MDPVWSPPSDWSPPPAEPNEYSGTVIGLRVIVALAYLMAAWVFVMYPQLMILDADYTAPEYAGVDRATNLLPWPMLAIAAAWIGSWWPARSVSARIVLLLMAAVALIALSVVWYQTLIGPYRAFRGT